MEKLLARWKKDVYEMFRGLPNVPFGGRRWEKDFVGEISDQDIHYAIFIGVASFLPAAVWAYLSTETTIKTMNEFFAAPVHAIVNGFLTAVLFFLGSHVHKVPRPFPVAFKCMLRVMAVYPILRFLAINNWGAAFCTLIYGFFVLRAAVKTYSVTVQSAVLFWGTTYFVFFLLQLQSGFKN